MNDNIANQVAEINQRLQELSTKRITAARDISPAYERLWQAVSQLVQKGGKRIRPRLVVMAAQVFGREPDDEVWRVACATELLHLSLLIHDDIIDRDDMRYGIANVTGQYLTHYAILADEHERRHMANSAAIMAGDLLLSEAHRQLAGCDGDIIEIFSQSIIAVCGGELLDTEAAFVPNPADPLCIAEYKTASYSFTGPLLLGATLAGATERDKQTLRDYAKQVGVAFQLRDDIIGMFGDTSLTGKTSIGDIREGKHTYLVELFHACADTTTRQEFATIYGVHGLSDDDYHKAADMIRQSGALAQCEAYITDLAKQAAICVDELSVNEPVRQIFREFITSVTERKA